MLWRAAVGNALGISRESYERLLQEVSASKKADAVQTDHAVGDTPRHLKLRGLIDTDLAGLLLGLAASLLEKTQRSRTSCGKCLKHLQPIGRISATCKVRVVEPPAHTLCIPILPP